MPKLSDRKPENRFTALFVGKSKSGKTVAAASFPKPLKIEDFDGRVGGAQVSWAAAAELELDKIDYDFYLPKEQCLITKINQNLEGLQGMAKLSSPSFPKSHVTDSITSECYAFLCQAIPLTHQSGKGKFLGITPMAGPEDYGLEAQATYDYISFLKSLPLSNIIISAHTIDRFAKEDPDNPFSASVVVGEKLSIRDKIGENIQIHFDHCFKFERSPNGERFFVTFRGGIASTSYDWLPSGPQEWTRKNFYKFMWSLKKG